MANEYVTAANLRMMDNSHYQYTLGYVSEDHWQRIRRNLKSDLQLPLAGPNIRRWKLFQRDSFRAVIEEIERELASE